MIRRAVALACATGLASCGAGRGSPSPTPSASAALDPARADCAEAAVQRGRVTGLLATGKLDRTRRVLRRASELCPSEAREGWLVEIQTLAELGDWDAVRALARTIESDARATADAKDAARAAVGRADADTPKPDTDEAKAPMRAAYVDAAAKAASRAHQEAYEGFLKAWELWHPNGQALIEAGRQATLLHRDVEAQRLVDRGVAELERVTGKSMTLDARNGMGGSVDDVVWSASGKIGMIVGQDVVVVTQSTMSETARIPGVGIASDLAFSRDGKALAIAGTDGWIGVWDTRSGAELARWERLPQPESLAFRPDGKELVSTFQDRSVRVWDLATGHLGELVPDASDRRLELVGDAELAFARREGALEIREVPPAGARGAVWGRPRARVEHADLVAAVSGDLRRVATTADDEAGVRVSELATGKLVGRIAKSWKLWAEDFHPRGAALSPDGSALAVGYVQRGASEDKYGIAVFDVATSELTWERTRLTTWSVEAFSPDGRFVLSAVEDGWELLAVDGGATARSFARHSHVSHVAFLTDGTLALWNDGYRAEPQTFLVDLLGSVQQRPIELEVHGGPKLAWGKQVFDGASQRTDSLGDVKVVALATDGSAALGQSSDGLLRAWDLRRERPEPRAAAFSAMLPAAISPGGTYVAGVVKGAKIRVFDADLEDKHRDYAGHVGGVAAIAFSADGLRFASAGSERTVRVWQQGQEAPLHEWSRESRWQTPPSPTTLSFSSDGRWLVVGWASWSTGESIAYSLEDFSEKGRMKGAVADISPSGALVATGSDDGSIYFWKTGTFEEVATLRAIAPHNTAYLFTPDGYVDALGKDGAAAYDVVRCRIGVVAFPFGVCRERFEVPGLAGKILAGDTSYALP